MSSKAVNKLNAIISRLEKAVKQSVSAAALKEIGEFTKDIVVKRTRLGYGVEKNFSQREKLAPLKKSYTKARSMFSGLSARTTPKKSNLTLTGQMLESMTFRVSKGSVTIFPSGTRGDGNSNLDVAMWNAKSRTYSNGYTKPARIFNRVSQLEHKQIVRFYKKSFTDLLKQLQLLK